MAEMTHMPKTSVHLSKARERAVPARAGAPGRTGLYNSERGYGIVAIVLHWLVALCVIGLFALGVWMTGLTYYDDWYKRGPDLHKSIGILLFFVMLARVIWRASNVKPAHEPGTGALQRRIADNVHILLYILLFAMMVSGYLISTADGKPIHVFGLFRVPATISDIPNQEDIAGEVHWYLALVLIGLASLHALAALKHHFIDGDRTLNKMLGTRSHRTTNPDSKESI